ncbi:MAG: cytochrome C [candidate division Zixibacteria bacterium]|nr:cytochrome C [candidate division Zixibacteria bacterium]
MTLAVLLIIFVVFIVFQFIPAGDFTNPPITGTPEWDSPQTEQLARQACFDCHSNETRWPWYASIAPISWRLQDHVEMGRRHLNFSEFDKPQRHATEAAEEVEEGHMPLWDYKLMHSDARLSDAEKRALIDGLRATFGESRRPDDNGD